MAGCSPPFGRAIGTEDAADIVRRRDDDDDPTRDDRSVHGAHGVTR
jgi:hypothetical protein